MKKLIFKTALFFGVEIFARFIFMIILVFLVGRLALYKLGGSVKNRRGFNTQIDVYVFEVKSCARSVFSKSLVKEFDMAIGD